jgi:hypothetical protein
LKVHRQLKQEKENQIMENRSMILMTILAGLTCFPLLPGARAVSPPPDGCYPNYTTAGGCNALAALTTGAGNTAVGWYSLFSVGPNSFNTGVGAGVLALNNADSNTAVGAAAMLLNTSGFENVANGTNALLNNVSGSFNDSVGAFALLNNIDGSFNNAFGNAALSQNISASDNTAIGDLALTNNDGTGNNIAYFNTAVGAQALFSNTDGNSNTAVGWQSLYFNDTGNFNTANGGFTLFGNINGEGNTATGYGALSNNTGGSSNTAIGRDAGTNVFTGSHVICIGAGVEGADVSNTTWIGNVYGVTPQSGTTAPVIVSDTGQVGTAASSERFKKDIAAMDTVSKAILSLRPVTFHYRTDTKGTPQFGLIAEEVAKVNPALVLPDKEGKPYTVRYDAVNAMLLNEFLKEHRKVEQLTKDFESKLAEQQKQIEALTKGLQKVSAQLEASKRAPQVVNNP